MPFFYIYLPPLPSTRGAQFGFQIIIHKRAEYSEIRAFSEQFRPKGVDSLQHNWAHSLHNAGMCSTGTQLVALLVLLLMHAGSYLNRFETFSELF